MDHLLSRRMEIFDINWFSLCIRFRTNSDIENDRWYFPVKHFLRRWMENFTSTASAFATGPEPNLTLNNDYKILKSHMFLWNHLLSRRMETFDINCFSLCNWSRTNSHIGKWQVVLSCETCLVKVNGNLCHQLLYPLRLVENQLWHWKKIIHMFVWIICWRVEW